MVDRRGADMVGTPAVSVMYIQYKYIRRPRSLLFAAVTTFFALQLQRSMLLSSLCRANIAILSQKVGLIEALVRRHGVDQARDVYRSVCPMVKASIGMHIRHSMDHMELAALVAENPSEESELHYDLRVRGGTLETDMDEAKKRILNVSNILKNLSSEKESTLSNGFVRIPVKATFFLSAEPIEYVLPSTIARELGTLRALIVVLNHSYR